MKKKQTFEMKKITRKNNGITLIALVITIIVLLILAAVSIATLTGENGILTRASDAAERTEKASIIEQAKTDILGIQAEKEDANITKGELKTVLDTYFKTVPDDYTTETVLETKDEYGKHEIAVSEIYNGILEETQEVISKTEQYVGYYADFEGDGEVEGIIYADLAIGNTGDGQWTNENGNYTILTEENVKDYYISNTNYNGPFGGKPVLSPTGDEADKADRFYVMALSDIDANTHYWYYNANGEMNDYATMTSGDFGSGRTNTEKMIAKWNNSGYGTQNGNDMWGLIQNKVADGWFVPSRGEWSAFAEELRITTNNYTEYGLSDWYWSSSQRNARNAYDARFLTGYINYYGVNNNFSYVRLSTTF